MQDTHYLKSIIERGKALYESGIKQIVESDPTNRGKRLALDTRTDEYEVDDDLIAAVGRLKARLPEAEPYALRVGYPFAFRLVYGTYGVATSCG